MRPQLALTLLFMLLPINAGCHWQRDGDAEPQFTRALRCHMRVGEVQRLARSLGSTNFNKAGLAGEPGIPQYFIAENDRLISLWFDQHGLVAYASVMTEPNSSGPDKLPIVQLCRGVVVTPP